MDKAKRAQLRGIVEAKSSNLTLGDLMGKGNQHRDPSEIAALAGSPKFQEFVRKATGKRNPSNTEIAKALEAQGLDSATAYKYAFYVASKFESAGAAGSVFDRFPTRARAETFLRKTLDADTSGLKKDTDWRSVNAIFSGLEAAGFEIQNLKSEYYKVRGSEQMNDGKRWTFEVPFTKGGWYVTITASFAGSAEDPSDAYDITVTASYAAKLST